MTNATEFYINVTPRNGGPSYPDTRINGEVWVYSSLEAAEATIARWAKDQFNWYTETKAVLEVRPYDGQNGGCL